MDESNFKWRWAHVDHTQQRDHYIGLLNRLRSDDSPAAFPNTLAWIAAQPGERILEVGCGNGAVARSVALSCPLLREIIAVDASAAMIAVARQQMQGRSLPVAFQVADAQRLPFADATFDRCYAQEIFVILPDPYQALVEMARVTRPGGHLCIWESDCDVHAIVSADLALARRLMRFVGDVEYNGAVARQIIGWLKAWGWEVAIIPAVSVNEEGTQLRATLLDEWLADAELAGAVSSDESAQFREEMRQRDAAGTFFSYLVNFRITATKPA